MAVTSSLVASSFITNPETPDRDQFGGELGIGVQGQDDDLRLRARGLQPFKCLDPAQPGHRNVRDDDIGTQSGRGIDEEMAIGHRADDFEFVPQQVDEAFAHECMIVRDQHPRAIH